MGYTITLMFCPDKLDNSDLITYHFPSAIDPHGLVMPNVAKHMDNRVLGVFSLLMPNICHVLLLLLLLNLHGLQCSNFI